MNKARYQLPTCLMAPRLLRNSSSGKNPKAWASEQNLDSTMGYFVASSGVAVVLCHDELCMSVCNVVCCSRNVLAAASISRLTQEHG